MPDGWLENESPMIPDPNAVKPADWYVFYLHRKSSIELIGFTFQG